MMMPTMLLTTACNSDDTVVNNTENSAGKGNALPVALNLTSPAVGQVVGDDGKNYDHANLPSGVAAVAKICYLSGNTGLAMAMADEGSMYWGTALTTATALTPAFSNGTWKVPTRDEWNNMINGYGLENLKTTEDGFTGLNKVDLYWTSNKVADVDNGAYCLDLYGGNVSWFECSRDDSAVKLRACLAF